MNKKELLKRWALAYIEPSLFYVPWNERNDDEYFTITIIPHVDYFDTLTETLVTNTTLQDIYIKGISYENQKKFGGLHEFVVESNSYIARDVNGNIVATSMQIDYMSVAHKTDESPIDNYTMEIYDVNMFEGSYTKRFVIKNIENLDDIDLLKEKITVSISYVLFVLKNGEIYRTISPNSKAKQVGVYNYKKNKYHFSDKNFYSQHMVYHSAPVVKYYNNPNMIGRHSILRLKKGTYSIEQIRSSGSCDIMLPITINVMGDMILNYNTKLNGYILRSYLENNRETVIPLSEEPLTKDITTIAIRTGTFSTFRSKSQIFALSDYNLQVQQIIKTAGVEKIYPSSYGNKLVSVCSNSQWVVTYDSLHSYQIQSTMCYPESLSEDFIINMPYSYWVGTDPAINRIYYNSNFYLLFDLFKLKPSTPFNLNELPNILEVEKIISSKSPEEWLTYGYARVNEYYGIKYSRRLQFSNIVSNYVTQTGAQGTCFDNALYIKKNLVEGYNLVESYYKNESTDIEKIKQCHLSSARYDEYEKIEGKRIFKNYTTYISDEMKYEEDWDETKVNSMLEQIAENMYIEQLK